MIEAVTVVAFALVAALMLIHLVVAYQEDNAHAAAGWCFALLWLALYLVCRWNP